MNIKFKKLYDYAIPFKYSRNGDACMDMFSREHIFISPFRHELIRTGICVEIPKGFEGQVRGRSGLAYKDGLIVHVGTIDCTYRGEIGVIMFNHSYNVKEIKTGMRIAQFSVHPVISLDLVESEELSSTERGTQGYGSSGS